VAAYFKLTKMIVLAYEIWQEGRYLNWWQDNVLHHAYYNSEPNEQCILGFENRSVND
jgi:hypothetical protein